ncbi:hypothetical protein PoB_005871300 [Plakobranchus ocellatus]|uniref:Uncharacterized protein n=1 Tax=Plakobranchus ocellatus TaxID=259542 RepID=A0AAV4CKM3_9GAST|nr:hypothetical protein PoB_005871300 [Plakobranchus ocellatus]
MDVVVVIHHATVSLPRGITSTQHSPSPMFPGLTPSTWRLDGPAGLVLVVSKKKSLHAISLKFMLYHNSFTMVPLSKSKTNVYGNSDDDGNGNGNVDDSGYVDGYGYGNTNTKTNANNSTN